jgi:hypothetical protein
MEPELLALTMVLLAKNEKKSGPKEAKEASEAYRGFRIVKGAK